MRNFYAPDNPSQKSFAVYYLRSCLMNSTIQPYPGIGWKLSSYFQHCKGKFWWLNPNNNWEWRDFGFNEDDTFDPPYGSARPIKSIAQNLFDPNIPLKLQDSYTTAWVKTQFDISQTYTDKYAWCGLKTSAGLMWGAIWRFKYGDDGITNPTTSPIKFS